MPTLAVITDEISNDLDHALDVCAELDLTAVELRVVGRDNIVHLTDDEIADIDRRLRERGMSVVAIASPFLKSEPWESDAQHRAQLDVLHRSIAIAGTLGAPVVRAFSFWRHETDPASRNGVALDALEEATAICREAGVLLGLENEHACTAATGAETRWFLDRIPDETLGVIWDPGNEAVVDSVPYPGGYEQVQGRIHHVHLKDAAIGHDPAFAVMGSGQIAYVAQFRALAEARYDGAISLETHVGITEAQKEAASRACIPAIRAMAAEAGLNLA